MSGAWPLESSLSHSKVGGLLLDPVMMRGSVGKGRPLPGRPRVLVSGLTGTDTHPEAPSVPWPGSSSTSIGLRVDLWASQAWALPGHPSLSPAQRDQGLVDNPTILLYPSIQRGLVRAAVERGLQG